jgi:hypothetical protein
MSNPYKENLNNMVREKCLRILDMNFERNEYGEEEKEV